MHWRSERFATVDLLVQFLNDHAVRPETCKVVVAPADSTTSDFILLYQPDDDTEVLLTVAHAEADPLDADDADEAVDAAEAILADAQRDTS